MPSSVIREATGEKRYYGGDSGWIPNPPPAPKPPAEQAKVYPSEADAQKTIDQYGMKAVIEPAPAPPPPPAPPGPPPG